MITNTEDKQELTYEELLSRITNTNKRAFLMAYPKLLNTKKAAVTVGLAEDTPYEWASRDRVFKQALLALKKRVDTERLEELEAELHTRAIEGVSKHSDILLMFGLKSLDPDKYREKPQSTHFTGDITVELAVPREGMNPQITDVKPKLLKEK
jgi:hypothetical protein